MLLTKLDKMAGLIEKEKMTYVDLAAKLSMEEENVEKVALILEKAGLARTFYPINMVEKPRVTLYTAVDKEERERLPGEMIEEYEVSPRGGHLSGIVKIYKSKEFRRPAYQITLPGISKFTRAYIDYVKGEVSQSVPLTLYEKSKEEITEQFNIRKQAVAEVISKDLKPDNETLERMAAVVLDEMYGLGRIEALIGDPRLEEIVINNANNPVSVYHRKFGWLPTNIRLSNEFEISNFAEKIARKVGKQISTLNPILDAHLSTGDRANATLYPVSSFGNTITLRLFQRDPWTLVSFLEKGTNCMSLDMAALLWQAMHYEMNIMIAGGTASGKTSALNALLALMPPHQRVVTIEDTRELMLPTYMWNWVPLVTRTKNIEGTGEVTMLDLLVNSLRMRPDRIILGEIRRKQEAEVLFEAMHTGHSVYSTVHADTGVQVLKRLTEPPIEVPQSEVEDINLLLVQYRDRRRNLRRTLELAEVVPGVEKPEVNRLFSWAPRTDSFVAAKKPHIYMQQMNLHTGFSEKEIIKDQADKKKVLDWMVKNKLRRVDDVGLVMRAYYEDEEAVVRAANRNLKPGKVL